jgi:hypothetical protein
MRLLFALLSLLLILPASCPAYQILLDLDDDDDPTTIREHTGAAEAVVRLVLQPTEPGEWITEITFGLGGTCWACDYIEPGWAIYGTDWDLYWDGGTLPEFPLLSGSGPSCVLGIECQGNPGFHCWWDAWAEGFHLTAPVFIGSFNARVADQVHPGCPNPPADLMAFANWSLEPGNVILLADPDLSAPELAAGIVRLLQNHPNPFNPTTTIGFELDADLPVALSIHDAAGRVVHRRDLGRPGRGRHEVMWRGVDDRGRLLPSGVYLCRLRAGDQVVTRRMVMLR